MTGPLEQLDALLGQMRRDLPNTDACLPNLAGDTLRAKAAVVQGYIDVLEPAVSALRAQMEAGRATLDQEERLADALAQGHTMRERHKARGRHHVIRALRAVLNPADAGQTVTTPARTYSYVKDGPCYICGTQGPVYRWDDYDESSECVCGKCATSGKETP
ncbi:hypothetical protein [Deinococcus sp. 12RED42]|uniref:hypothetical protein n=1 Tax=Deinococcus sp. 12RED42 TaxID=2745872 RepID=UPI001E4F49D8|nr:hypothetical protein [Deinococcus sp. 12RED42]MCD0167104.1 hypothetical protein [Deinococcus sp. 12RED42]